MSHSRAHLCIATAVVGIQLTTPALAAQNTDLELPTPAAHFAGFDIEQAARALGARILPTLDPATAALLLGRLGPNPAEALGTLPPDAVLQLLGSVDLSPWRQDVLELLLHQSQILDVFAGDMRQVVPVFHDALLIILDGMDEDRLAERIADQAGLPAGTPRGERMLSLMAKTPIFQKLGQILARNPTTDPDIRASFQQLENQVNTMQAADMVAMVQAALGDGVVQQYQMEFESEILGEATVGAVIGATVLRPGDAERLRVVVKVIKDYAVVGIQQDVASIERAVVFLEDHRATYDIGSIALIAMFSQVLESLEQEIQVLDEQANLRRAGEYFASDPRVIVPALYDLSTTEVTVMERVEGFRVTDAYPGDPVARKRLARRLLDITVLDVLVADGDTLFHGDPHAGNVFWSGTEERPNRIGLLDWGLMGGLELERRRKLTQIMIGLDLKHRDRLRDNIDGLLTNVPQTDEARAELRDVVDEALVRATALDQERQASGRGEVAADREDDEQALVPVGLTALNDLLGSLALAGYAVHSDMLLYVKSLFTIQGVASDLDPDLDITKYLRARIWNQVLKETPRRFMNMLWIPNFTRSHNYPSMLSNADVFRAGFHGFSRSVEAPRGVNQLSIGVAGTRGGGEDALAIGIEYELRAHRLFGVGGVVEQVLDEDTVVVALPFFTWHATGGFRVRFGFGLQRTEVEHAAPGDSEDDDDDNHESDSFFRIGVQYAIDVGDRFAILPTLDLDLKAGDNRAAFGVRVAYSF